MGVPCLSMLHPPTRPWVASKVTPGQQSSITPRTLRASAITSGPAWSPGRTRIFLGPVAVVLLLVVVVAEFLAAVAEAGTGTLRKSWVPASGRTGAAIFY